LRELVKVFPSFTRKIITGGHAAKDGVRRVDTVCFRAGNSVRAKKNQSGKRRFRSVSRSDFVQAQGRGSNPTPSDFAEIVRVMKKLGIRT